MNYTFNELKKKSVINLTDGKRLGKISDITVSYPKCCLESITVTNNCINVFSQDKIILTPCDIQRIGEDAILVKLNDTPICANENLNKVYEEE